MAARPRHNSNASLGSAVPDREQVGFQMPTVSMFRTYISNQELGSMYDYLAKVILIGPSGSGKSCLLHRVVKDEWRVLSSQTIGVEFSSKIIKIGTGSRRKRIKLQLWDTAGTERFRSVARSYYRGAAGAILVYDVASHSSFSALPTFLNDARALASPNLTVLLAGNKSDLLTDQHIYDEPPREPQSASTPNSPSSRQPTLPNDSGGHNGSARLSASQTVTIAPEGREILVSTVSQWASSNKIPVSVEVSAYSAAGVEELFSRLARMILTKIELGEIDPDDPASGIQYGDASWRGEDGLSVKSGGTTVNEEGGLGRKRRRGGRGKAATGGWAGGMREWEAVFRLDGAGRRRRGGCC